MSSRLASTQMVRNGINLHDRRSKPGGAHDGSLSANPREKLEQEALDRMQREKMVGDQRVETLLDSTKADAAEQAEADPATGVASDSEFDAQAGAKAGTAGSDAEFDAQAGDRAEGGTLHRDGQDGKGAAEASGKQDPRNFEGAGGAAEGGAAVWLDDMAREVHGMWGATEASLEQNAAAYKEAVLTEAEFDRELQAVSPDIYGRVRSYDGKFRNPCFYDQEAEGRLRCLPYFSILGVSKCGTTDMYHKLMMLNNTAESNNKGPHFWDESKPFERYLEVYDNIANKVQQSPRVVTADASSATFSISPLGVRLKPSRVSLPLALKTLQPDMKIVILFRNPVDRYYSAYYYYNCIYNKSVPDLEFTPQTFHQQVLTDVGSFQACLKEGASVRECYVKRFWNAQQLLKGMYAIPLPEWLVNYSDKEMLIWRTEDYSKGGTQSLKRAIQFLDLDMPDDATLESISDRRFNEGVKPRPVPGCGAEKRKPMLPETRQILETFYAPYNRQLAKSLKNDAFLWEDSKKHD
ncbi:hypothetical protein H632_c895p1 [Helicosporidium sp. ATCC 50920]|nr:hypothetical protein H632_c895p1 [Helicosporidium sp. ATCC 50920]|eukprot:KDD75062.1 hypothetical protein H632_c895p1 [Helicosporidium sp. ATCC 50920]